MVTLCNETPIENNPRCILFMLWSQCNRTCSNDLKYPKSAVAGLVPICFKCLHSRVLHVVPADGVKNWCALLSRFDYNYCACSV